MRPSRREVLVVGGGLAAALGLSRFTLAQSGFVDIAMAGRPDGSRVWFDPIGVLIEPGQTVRWTNFDRGNSHTATAYHSANAGHATRMPAGANPWDSGYLLPDGSFTVTLTEPGVYDYYCTPHEHAGMVGRIIVGAVGDDRWMDRAEADRDVPAAAIEALPAIADILASRAIHPTEGGR